MKDNLTDIFMFRLSPELKRQIRIAAAVAGVDMSQFIRDVLEREATKMQRHFRKEIQAA